MDNLVIDYSENKYTCDDIYKRLKSNGIMCIENYYNDKELEELNVAFNMTFEHKDVKLFEETSENLNNDIRIFNANKYMNFDIFSSNDLFISLANKYFYEHPKSFYSRKIDILYPMLNKLEYSPYKKSNSGGTWHRDNPNGMIKFIMYLTDCDINNGCLQFLTNSSINHIGNPETSHKINKRYNDKDIDTIIKKYDNIQLLNITGKKGTIVILDASYIHRGNIITEKNRYAITLYPYEVNNS